MEINYYALHYHMKQSGVRTVIEDILESLQKDKGVKLNLIYSSKRRSFLPENKKIKPIHLQDVAYNEKVFKSKEALMTAAEVLKDKIKSKLDLSKECVLHCHNVNLMKNTCLGAALLLLANELVDKKFILLLQVHDFAEERRENLLNLIYNCSGKKDRKFGSMITYPIGRNICYMTINSRDKALLSMVGVPKNRIFLYPNTIDTDFFLSKPKGTASLLSKLELYAEKNDYLFDKNRKILLYPVKILRRKNVIETLLILKLLNAYKNEWQLLITLEGKSKADLLYGNKIKNFIRTRKLPVVIGFGYKLISGDETREKGLNNMVDLFSISDAIITTSVQEGFGFTFLEGWVAGKKVIGREIKHIFKDLKRNKLNMNHFYNEIIFNGKDFAKYHSPDQLKFLKRLHVKECKNLIKRSQLKRMVGFLYHDNNKIINNNRNVILKRYSLGAYRTRLQKIIVEAKKLKRGRYKKPVLDNKKLVNYFKKLDNLPLIK